MVEMYVVQQGVPRPDATRRGVPGKRRKYPFDTMRVDDFFFVPLEAATSKSISAYVSRTTKDIPGKFSTQHAWAVKDGEGYKLVEAGTAGAIEGTGVWRDQ